MGIINAFANATSGTLSDQWRDIIVAGPFDEHAVVVPGIYKETNNGRGANTKHSDGVISNGSKILVPENTAAFIFKQAGIETVITEPGEYEYNNGEESIFSNRPESKGIFDHVMDTVVDQAMDRTKYGGISKTETRIAFVNLREIRGIKFGTRGPQVYHDLFYKCDLEIFAYGTLSVQVVDPERFVRNFVPANIMNYSFDEPAARQQLIGEFIQSFSVALNVLSTEYRIAQLPGQAANIARAVSSDEENVGTWEQRFGLRLAKIGIESIEFSDDSRELVRTYSSQRMEVAAYEDISQRASNMAAQQKIAQGIQDNGFGDGAAGMIFGMNMAQGLDATASPKQTTDFDNQIETLKKLKELVDAGILTQEEFDAKKREIMGL